MNVAIVEESTDRMDYQVFYRCTNSIIFKELNLLDWAFLNRLAPSIVTGLTTGQKETEQSAKSGITGIWASSFQTLDDKYTIQSDHKK